MSKERVRASRSIAGTLQSGLPSPRRRIGDRDTAGTSSESAVAVRHEAAPTPRRLSATPRRLLLALAGGSTTSVSLAGKLSTDVLVTTLVKLSLKVRGIVVIPLLTISLGTAAYGAYVQVFVVATLLGQVAVLGADTGVVQFLQQYGDDRPVVYWTLSSVLAVTGTAGALLVAAAAEPLASVTLGSAGYASAFVVGAPLVPLTIYFRLGQGYLRATRRIKHYAATDAAEVYSHVGAVAAVVLLTDWGVTGVLAAVVTTRAVVVGAIHLAIAAEVGLERPSPRRLRRYLSYSLPTTGTDVARSALTRVDRVLVGAFLGASAVGVYSVAYQVAQGTLLYVQPLSIALFPEFSRLWAEDRERVRDLAVTGLRYFLALAVPTIGGFWLVGEQFLSLLTTAETAAAAAPLLVLLGAGISLQGLSTVYTELFYAADETGVPFRIQSAAAIANLLLNVALLPVFGIVGAAAATILAFGLAAGVTVVAFQRWLSVLPPVRALAVPAGAALVMTATFWLASSWWVLTVALGPLVYGVAFVAGGGVDRGELATVLRALGGSVPGETHGE